MRAEAEIQGRALLVYRPSRSMTSPTMLLGVDAPAVSPMTTLPERGSQSREISSRLAVVEGAPIGR